MAASVVSKGQTPHKTYLGCDLKEGVASADMAAPVGLKD
jgi:hypothetical protein